MKIGTINIDEYVNNLNIQIYSRSETKVDNVLGDRLIDRGKLKYKITFTLNLLTNTEWISILSEIKKTSFSLTFTTPDVEDEVTKTFSVSVIPSPRLRYTSTTTYYSGISLELEEL